jgi:hypothetical protein
MHIYQKTLGKNPLSIKHSHGITYSIKNFLEVQRFRKFAQQTNKPI